MENNSFYSQYNSRELIKYCHSHLVNGIYLIRSSRQFRMEPSFAVLIITDKDKLQVYLTSHGNYVRPYQPFSATGGVRCSFRNDNSDLTDSQVHVVHTYYPKVLQGSEWDLISQLTIQELSKFLEFFDLFAP